jgi:FlaA1/EpsC-like NDP-sugar epimerase
MHYPRRSYVAACHDIIMALCSVPLALYLRLGDNFWVRAADYVTPLFIIFISSFAFLVFSLRMQKAVWRYVSLSELKLIVKVVSLSIIIAYAAMFLFYRLENVPRSLPVIQWLLLMVLLGAPRILYRMMCERGHTATVNVAERINVLLVGAGNHAEAFVRAMQRDAAAQYKVVGIIDNDRSGRGRSLHGVPIMGDIGGLERAIVKLEERGNKPQRLILSEDYMDQITVQTMLDICDAHGVSLGQLPRLTDFTLGTRTHVQPIAIEDLLGRPQTMHDREMMQEFIAGKIVIVTGAGGSIGSELVRQIAGFAPQHILLLEQSEYQLYLIHKELQHKVPTLGCTAILCNVRDKTALQHIFSEYRPQIVFHAAAIKHVPLAETNVEETLLTNVFGTQNVAECCAEHKVQHMVLISTDKAVHPANVMGASKRLAEYICADMGSRVSTTHYSMVRFGNVLGSTGSVVPLFEEQLRAGGPLTVTHPDMERYFMTIREASGLVIQAAALPSNATALYILDMGKPVKITALAEQMIKLAGYVPHRDIRIEFTGQRIGEKLTELLVYDEESLQPTEHPSIKKSACPMHVILRQQDLQALHTACMERNKDAALRMMESLIADYAREEKDCSPKMIYSAKKEFV